jgi:hypothetical protein
MLTNIPVRDHGVMEGKGAYNRYAKLPAGGGALALPLWEKAVRSVELEHDDQTIVIADYGSSQGKNSLAPMRLAIKTLRERLAPGRSISVFHIDQPSNDFNTLFEVLDTDPDSYTLDEPDVFPCAVGKSFYKKVFPQGHVHLGWCSYAAVWLSRIPAQISGHFIAHRSTGAEHAAFARQAAQDWEAFLSLRASELRSGGRLVVVLPALSDDGVSGFEGLMDQANTVLEEMVHEGAIGKDERERMVLGAYPRRRCDLLAPFQPRGQFCDLSVESCDLFPLEDSIWADYERDGDNVALATRQALFFRSIFVPSLALSLNEAQDAEQRRIFADRFENGLKRRLANQPAPLHSFVQSVVLAKRGSAPIDA